MANAETVTRVAATPGRPAWTTTSAPPACSARISPASVAGVDVVGADDDAVRRRLAATAVGEVGELAEPEVAAAGGLGLGLATDDADDLRPGLGVDLGEPDELDAPAGRCRRRSCGWT